ncbi:3-hydroxyacyl-CoA dehydrogenase family protein [Picrophilus oshimae]|uniref:3-hydroxyacyl-CoA dehydrogenase n=1 Tax=Picrophilus torridus (strain ATCC 700027 / DSM 9790 / JCM 10055 / NBRC 100828 / KAW 2/3) TaxID=1122961 RepID=A0A8G2FWL1_PICTO|nr:3-hydroxyacyl-CoA dehydrogenase family protein [Picrophilus oshimae]SMD30842.1 3-hydroxyacyl-CoA dehydrogenase [Picrophilus oshimae DSM 9789]
MRVTVIGAGTMGSGIAEVFALNNHEVLLSDVSNDILNNGRKKIEASLEKFKEKGRIKSVEDVLEKISMNTDINAQESDLYIEAVLERIDVKRDVLSRIRSDAIIATNTSSISITYLSKFVRNPEKFIGMHFFNPPPIMSLIEIVRGNSTSDETTKKIVEISRSLGKTPVEVNDFPGFVSNRVLMAMLREAIIAYEENVASAEGIDTVMKLGMNHPMGPLELSDFIGLDVVYDIMNVLYNDTGSERFKPPITLRNLVYAGKLGRKTGEGFYKYK